EVPEVRRRAQRAIDPRRADLEVERLRDRVLDVEHGRQLARQGLAVREADAIRRHLVDAGVLVDRQVDRHAQRPAALLEHEAQVDQLVAACLADGLDDRDEALVEWVSGHGRTGRREWTGLRRSKKVEKKGGRKATSNRGAIEARGSVPSSGSQSKWFLQVGGASRRCHRPCYE